MYYCLAVEKVCNKQDPSKSSLVPMLVCFSQIHSSTNSKQFQQQISKVDCGVKKSRPWFVHERFPPELFTRTRCIARPRHHTWEWLTCLPMAYTLFTRSVSLVCLPDTGERKTNLRFYDAPLTLAVLALPLALTHYAVSLVWNWQVQKFGHVNHLPNLPKRANGSIACLGRCSQQI